ncbi:hypothetical protein LTK22_24560, partial [Klebsiella quasipneumoniae subsp. quasipneumoniae]|uniref:hypothetical protein n=1 Tax=Klebsiella quasipneumoniae TaxID=1463165 RepID=UPI001E31B59D
PTGRGNASLQKRRSGNALSLSGRGSASILKPVCNKRLSVPIYRYWFLSNIRVAITKILEVDKNKPLPVPTKI